MRRPLGRRFFFSFYEDFPKICDKNFFLGNKKILLFIIWNQKIILHLI